MAHPDLPAEQAYLEEAYECLDRMRKTLIRTAGAAATEEAAQAIEDWANGRLRTFEDAERGLCFGRIDSEEAADPISRRALLGSRRRPPRAGRQLADARGAPVLHGHAGRPARSHAPAPLSHPRQDADGNQRRGTRRLARRRGGLRG